MVRAGGMRFVDIAKAGELREGAMRCFEIAGRRILLANVGGRHRHS